eukprot:6316510-Pyramimonas_sp.AAC.1
MSDWSVWCGRQQVEPMFVTGADGNPMQMGVSKKGVDIRLDDAPGVRPHFVVTNVSRAAPSASRRVCYKRVMRGALHEP